MHPNEEAARTVVKVSTPADILGVLPHRLGFHPRESLVVICLEGPRRRDQLVMRLDLVAEKHDDQVAADLAVRVGQAGASAAVIVCYTAAPDNGQEPARSGLVDALEDRLAGDGIPVVEALLVRDGRWWSYRCNDATCCAGQGTLLPTELTPAASLYAAEAVVGGAAVVADRQCLVDGIEPSRHPVAAAVRAQAVDDAAEVLAAAVRVGGPGAVMDLTVGAVRRLVHEWSEGRCDVSPVDAALVALGLHDKPARDAAMTLVLDHEPGLLASLLTELARRTDDVDAAPVCTVLAWAAHADGGGALATVAAERAVRCQPGYAMAELVLTGLDRMVTPADILALSAQVRADLAERDRRPG